MPGRVCVLTSVHQPFDGRIFHRQCKTLAQAGYQVTLIAPADFDRQRREGVTVIGVPRPASRLLRPLVWCRLFLYVTRLRPDVVHFHDPELLLVAGLLKLTVGRRICFVYDVHEYVVDSVREKTWLPGWLRTSTAILVNWLEPSLTWCLSGLVCVIEDQLTLYGKLSCPKVVVHNYPALADFTGPRLPHEYKQDQFRLIYIGSIFERRGILTTLEAFRMVAQQVPNAHLFLGGNYEDPLFEKRIKRFITDNGLQIHLLGRVPFSRVKDYLTFAHCACMPGRMTIQFSNRGLSTKILEAMICAVPIVSVDLPHRRELIEPAEAGLLVKPDDPIAQANAILWLYQHPDEAEVMGAHGQAWVSKRYVWEQESKVLLRFYEQLMDKGPGK